MKRAYQFLSIWRLGNCQPSLDKLGFAICITLHNSKNKKMIYNSTSVPLMKSLMQTSEDAIIPHLNGKNTRSLGLNSNNTLFAFTKEIHSISDNPIIGEKCG